MFSVGLDYHSKSSSLEILDAAGATVKHLEVKGDWTKLVKVVDQQVPKPFVIGFEASCGYGHLYEQLVPLAQRVEVGHPGHMRLIFHTKRKHDRIDSRKIAKLVHMNMLPKVHVPKSEIRQWRSFIEFRHRVISQLTAAKVQMRALCRDRGIIGLPPGRKLFTRAGIAQLKALELSEVDRLQRDMILEDLSSLSLRQKMVEKQLQLMAARHPEVKLLMTIPGVGIRTAEAFMAYVDDIRRFTRINCIGSYFGMIPCEDSSAGKHRYGHITKDGPATVRWLITEAAWQGVNRSATIKAFYQRVMHDDPERRKKALVATGHYLLRVMAAMLRSGKVWKEKEGLALLAPPIQQEGPTLSDRPDRTVIHDGAQVAPQQSPILRVDNHQPNSGSEGSQRGKTRKSRVLTAP